MATDEALAARANQVAETAAGALSWFDSQAENLREDRAQLTREFRRFGRRAARLAIAATRPMCVAVFGPSQAGKSYLISALARKGAEPLEVMLGGERVDFIEKINPEGGKEATGLVTRFSVRPQPSQPGRPVGVRLLSAPDVIKIFANSFFEDFNRDTIEPLRAEDVADTIAALKIRAGQPAPGMSEDDVYDLAEYMRKEFGGHPVVRALGQQFWHEAAALAPRLSVPDRAKLFAVLWNNMDGFTKGVVGLLQALDQLGYPEEAFLPLAALMPRHESVIDVEALRGLDGGAPLPPLDVLTPAGRSATIPRSMVAGLIAELRLQLADKPWDFFDSTDLLDFPGARSRETFTDPGKFAGDGGKISALFLRGKVAYLFQRYVADQELTAMLLCIAPSNQEVRTLPRMIREWIDTTHGASPAERAKQNTSLYVVLTKFDMEFETKRGMEGLSDTSRWSTRLETTFTKFLGQEFTWPTEWHPGTPFTNVFWLRNPNFPNKALFDYDDGLRETGLRGSEQDRMARLREGFVANDDVRRHFADPTRSWDEAMKLNDGGIGFLARSLAPVCRPELKRRQVEGQLRELAATMATRLKPYFRSGDLEQELTKRRAEARAAGLQLVQCAGRQRFGPLLREWTVSADRFADLFYRLQFQAPAEKDKPAPARAIGTRIDTSALAQDFLSAFEDASAPAPSPEPEADDGPPLDQPGSFAAAALDEWKEQLAQFADSAEAFSVFMLDKDSAATVTQQLAIGARRLRLAHALAERIRANLYRERLGESVLRLGVVAAEHFGGYVATLGFDAVPEAQRPKAGRDQRPVFRAVAADDDIPKLGATPEPFDSAYTLDWITAFVRLTEDNVRGDSGSQVDIAANAALGRLLGALDANVKVAAA
jgi:hypothetical protein